MAVEQQEIPQEKKREYKTICLFGKTISVECSSLESNETAMLLVDVPISPEKEADEDLQTHKEDSVSVDLSLAISGNPNLDSKITCAGNETAMLLVDVPISSAKEADKGLKTLKEDSVPVDLSLSISGNPNLDSNVTCAGLKKEDVRKIKKRRSLPKEEREEEQQIGPWTITKKLVISDIGSNSRLTVKTKGAENHIVRHLSADAQIRIQQGTGVQIRIYDHNSNTEHNLIFKRYPSSKSYIFNGDWMKGFVQRRNLEAGDTIGLFWNNAASRLHFAVLRRKTIIS